MIELFKITLVFVFAIVLINRRVNVGKALLITSLVMGLLFGMGIGDILSSGLRALVDEKTLTLIGIVVLMTFMGNLMSHLGNLRGVIDSLENLVSDLRIVSASIPAFIGLMPMPGGAMLSAPFVKEVGEKLKLTAEQSTVVNYWFRHIWEYSFPFYPAVILAPALVGMSIRDFSIMMVPFTLFSIIIGTVFLLSRIRKVGSSRENTLGNIKRLFIAVWPVLFVIIAYIGFGVDLLVSLFIAIAILLLISCTGVREIWKILRESKAVQMGFLVACVMVFKFIITETHSVESLPDTFTQFGIPLLAIVFFIPFISGLLTGITIGAIGISFPIIMSALVDGGLNTGNLMLAYMGSYLGVLSSPVHLCLVLSKDYFSADFGKVYRMLAPLIVLMVVFAIVFLFL